MSQSSVAMPSVVLGSSFSGGATASFFPLFNIQACTPRLGLASSFYRQMKVLDLGPNLVRIGQPNGIRYIPQIDSTMIVRFCWQNCPPVLSLLWVLVHQVLSVWRVMTAHLD
jgi:hypothetical protein